MEDEFVELVHKMRFITQDEHIKILNEIVEEIKAQNLSNEEIVDMFSSVDAEIVSDIIKVLEDENYITVDDGYEIDSQLTKIYEEEYIRDSKSGVLQSRLQLKTNKNARPISTFEILGIFFAKTLNYKLLWGIETTDDEFLNSLINTHNELRATRKENAIFKKRQENMEANLTDILNKLKEAKTLTT